MHFVPDASCKVPPGVVHRCTRDRKAAGRAASPIGGRPGFC